MVAEQILRSVEVSRNSYIFLSYSVSARDVPQRLKPKGLSALRRSKGVQFHDILYTMFRDILYTPARTERGRE